jgi:hypothetical protein
MFGGKNNGENAPCPDIVCGISQGIQMQHLTIQEIRARIDKRVSVHIQGSPQEIDIQEISH